MCHHRPRGARRLRSGGRGVHFRIHLLKRCQPAEHTERRPVGVVSRQVLRRVCTGRPADRKGRGRPRRSRSQDRDPQERRDRTELEYLDDGLRGVSDCKLHLAQPHPLARGPHSHGHAGRTGPHCPRGRDRGRDRRNRGPAQPGGGPAPGASELSSARRAPGRALAPDRATRGSTLRSRCPHQP